MAGPRGKTIKMLTLAIAALLLAQAPAFAQRSSNWRGCTGNSDVDWERQIVACTALIDGGAEFQGKHGHRLFQPRAHLRRIWTS